MVYQSVIRRTRYPPEHDGVFIINKHLKILTRLQMKLLPHRARQDDLAFLANRGHSGIILPILSIEAIGFLQE